MRNDRATAPSLETAGMLRIACSQMAWKGCAVVRTNFRAGAKANRSLRSQFVCWPSGCDSRHAARITFQATSAMAPTFGKMCLEKVAVGQVI
jgi:hypothetical protein